MGRWVLGSVSLRCRRGQRVAGWHWHWHSCGSREMTGIRFGQRVLVARQEEGSSSSLVGKKGPRRRSPGRRVLVVAHQEGRVLRAAAASKAQARGCRLRLARVARPGRGREGRVDKRGVRARRCAAGGRWCWWWRQASAPRDAGRDALEKHGTWAADEALRTAASFFRNAPSVSQYWLHVPRVAPSASAKVRRACVPL